MPAINRVRIVNFTYNDGKRIIPDEEFVFENMEHQPLDTLIDLINGGGKSVLVQLMLQPVLPRASIGGRKIESYFRKASDHCFVLIEWKLDNSADRMMTGIAIAAGLNADEGNYSNVRYYTFVKKYSDRGDKNDVNSIPLSQNENGRFKALSFEDARTLVKNANQMAYYSSDDVRKYYQLLNEHGIMHSEWDSIIRKINDCEGGVQNFFEGYKTVDNLLNKFIIPGIQNNTFEIDNKDSLDEMFINFAERFSKMSENAKLRDDTNKFVEMLNALIPEVENLWNFSDKQEKAIQKLFDYIFSVTLRLNQTKTELETSEQKIAAFEDKRNHIELERLSLDYYNSQKELADVNELYNEKQSEYDRIKQHKIDSDHRKEMLDAAEKYGELTAKENERKSLTEQIRQKEADSENEYARQLKYSLYLAADRLNADSSTELQTVSSDLGKTQKDKTETEKIKSNCVKYISELNGTINENNGILRERKKSIDERLAQVGIEVMSMLDGSYNESDLADGKKRLADNLSALHEGMETLCKAEQEHKKEQTDLHDRKTENADKLNSTQAQCKEISAQIEEYNKKYAAAESALQHWNIDISHIFDDSVRAFLCTQQDKLNAEIKSDERCIEQLDEKISCAKVGKLHLPPSAVSFLDSTGIDYTTGESYLLSIDETVRRRILQCNPEAAYSVVVFSDNERSQMFDSVDNETWISSVIPVYTYDDFAKMSENRFAADNSSIAAYSREYFDENKSFIELVENQLNDAVAKHSVDKQNADKTASHITALNTFNYSVNDFDEMKKSLAETEKRCADIEKDNAKIASRLHTLEEESDQISKDKITLSAKTERAESNISSFEKTLADINDYYELQQANDKCRQNLSAAEKECTASASRLDELNAQTDSLAQRKKELIEKITLAGKALTELGECSYAEIINGDFFELNEQYNSFIMNLNTDIAYLKLKQQECENVISQRERSLERFKEFANEYTVITFSNDERDAAACEIVQLTKQLNACESVKNDLFKRQSQAESRFDMCQNKLEETGEAPLNPSEIGTNFKERISTCQADISNLRANKADLVKAVSQYNTWIEMAKGHAEEYAQIRQPQLIEFDEQTCTAITKNISECTKSFMDYERRFSDSVTEKLGTFAEYNSVFADSKNEICKYISSNTEGDHYFTLKERLLADIARYKQIIGRLDTDLKDIDESRDQLTGICFEKGRYVYDRLKMLTNKSKVNVDGKLVQILKIELPDIDNKEAARQRVSGHISSAVGRYVALSTTATDSEKTKYAAKCVELRTLLNCYIDRESIAVSVYKFDSNPANSGHRPWEKAVTANSGGEKFVVFFALVLSMMNYSRGIMDSLKKTSGVLIMDNPFGPISSEHLLRPMFDIANHFRIQLICLSHIDTADIMKCFRNVYQAKIIPLALSSVEVLELSPVDGEKMESGFYRSEQLVLT